MAQPVIHSLIHADIGGFKPLVDYPGDNCCFLYDDYHFDYHGHRMPDSQIDDRRELICHTGARTEINIHNLGWGDRMASYICGKNVWYDFCSDGAGSNCTGGDRVNSGAGFSKNYAVRHMHDRLSHAVLGPYDPREIGAVTIFEDDTCSGASGRYYWDPESN